jgi:hypothetical protein
MEETGQFQAPPALPLEEELPVQMIMRMTAPQISVDVVVKRNPLPLPGTKFYLSSP